MYFGSSKGLTEALRFWLIMGMIGIGSTVGLGLFALYWLVTNISFSFT